MSSTDETLWSLTFPDLINRSRGHLGTCNNIYVIQAMYVLAYNCKRLHMMLYILCTVRSGNGLTKKK